MAIPESQLDTWAHQGSVTQSAETYRSVKRALEDPRAAFNGKDFNVFLQGSYGNDSNIYAESDVDVIICYNSAFFHDLALLPPAEQQGFSSHFADGAYPYSTFKTDVESALRIAFGSSVESGKKAIRVKANGSRRSSDVVVAFEFRRYYKFRGANDQSYDTGICFFTQGGVRIANYPKQHSENCTAKHQATGSNFKPVVRIFKNLRGRLVADGLIDKSIAPSYFIEGLIYNAPNALFSGTYQNMVYNVLNWIYSTKDRSKLLCANEQYFLLRDNAPECWPTADSSRFVDGALALWNRWAA